MFFDTGRDGKDIGIENYVGGWEFQLLHQHIVAAFADRFLLCQGIGLPVLIEGHDDHSRAIFQA